MRSLKLPFFLLLLAQAAIPVAVRAQAARTPAKPAAAPAAPIVVQAAPAGDTLAVLRAGTRVQAVGRQGEWTRVRVEGWTRSPVPGAPAAGLTPSLLRAEPEAHRGQSVAWSARFLALQRADPVRTDFTPGELYVLARDPNDEAGFVYIAVTPEQALAVRRLIPMQKFGFVARVRHGASPLMGHPVLELVELRS
ncbi:MAG TPA: hypothetical protein VK399_10475 [Longimicrobiaceae bacterium]|nr:hypothetical protein [Longimicrobiaceae bacterium]